MKRFAAVITAGALMLSLAACSVEVNNKETGKSEESTEETTEVSEDTTEDTTEPSESETTGETAVTNVICAWKDYAIDTLGIQDYIDLYTADGGEDDTQIMIYPEGDIKQFTLYTITNWDVQQDGSFTYDKAMSIWEPSLDGNRGYLISIRLHGDLPEYGYSYEEDDGTVRMFIIEVSGEDGSIVTIPD